MRPSQALRQHREAVCRAAARYHVTNPRVFGSALRGDDGDGSDLDLLVDTLPGTTLLDLGGLQDELQELLGVPVDVLTLKDLPAKFRDTVAQEARPV
ncbi:MAG TPA: nucleotidyltransferase family protein [Giesbergeria sp.]|jgi:predicted nucleotidyltransferase|nr:nucleotidyltransferase family protein [Giesbergeria sp.]